MIHFFLEEKKRIGCLFSLCSLKACEHWNDDNGDNSRFRFAIFVLHELTQLQKYASLIMPISSVVGVCEHRGAATNIPQASRTILKFL